MRPPHAANERSGKPRQRAATRCFCCLTSSRATCSASSAQAYATDQAALAVAERAIAKEFDKAFPLPERRFFYTPHMHAEDLAEQERCLALCAASGDEEGVKYAVIHRDIIRDFGRFPHRNPVLGRETTPEEHAFLQSGGFSG